MEQQSQFLTIANAAKKYAPAGFTEGSLRWLKFNSQTNGFADCFIKVGNKLLLDDHKFVARLREKGNARKEAR